MADIDENGVDNTGRGFGRRAATPLSGAVKRKPNGRPASTAAPTAAATARVIIGLKDDGRTDRRHVTGRRRAMMITKVHEPEWQCDEGIVRRRKHLDGQAGLTHPVGNIAASRGVRTRCKGIDAVATK